MTLAAGVNQVARAALSTAARFYRLVFYRLEAVTAAHCGDFQMKARMPGMAAVIDEIFRRFLGGSNLRKNSVGRVIFSKMGAQTTLTFLHM
ncbi:MAG TPA: hypothetical protein VH369_06545 [Bryobacteraceae bacterium]|jgi:hypothetical protein